MESYLFLTYCSITIYIYPADLSAELRNLANIEFYFWVFYPVIFVHYSIIIYKQVSDFIFMNFTIQGISLFASYLNTILQGNTAKNHPQLI
jgi:hypothetical protein